MRTISLTITKHEKVDIEVEFPIYRKHVFDSSTSYTKITEDLRAVTIDIPDMDSDRRKIEIEIQDHYNFDWSEPEYHLGRGKHRSSERDFQNAWNQAFEMLNSACPFDE